MNLFRSEEHVRRWPLHLPTIDNYVLPLEDWMRIMGTRIFRERLSPDYLDCIDEYLDEYLAEYEGLGFAVPSDDRVLLSLLMTDIVDSTMRASTEGDEAWLELLERHDAVVRMHLAHYGGHEVKQTGDGFLASFDTPARAVSCARAIAEAARDVGLESRAGVHLGECEVRERDLGGIAVHIVARIAGLADAGEVVVSRTVADAMAGSGVAFDARGRHELKGVPGEWEVLVLRT